MKKLLEILFFCAISSAVFAAENPTPSEKFREQTNYELLMCQIKAKIAINNAKLGKENPWSEAYKCIKDGKLAAKKLFTPALASVAKNADAKKILKDYYAAWITSINGIPPTIDERKSDYEQRQAASESRHDELWQRFEIEAGL